MAYVLKGSQFYLDTPHSSTNGMNHISLPSRSWYSFTHPGGMDHGRLSWDTYLVIPAANVRTRATEIDNIVAWVAENLRLSEQIEGSPFLQ